MIQVTRKYTRPSMSIAWHHETTEGISVDAYRVSAYGSKMSDQTGYLSGDGLTWIYQVNWLSQADFDVSRSDQQFMAGQSARQLYNDTNGILVSAQTIKQI